MFTKNVFGFCLLLVCPSLVAALPLNVDLELQPWRAVNDGVMGGVSTGSMVSTANGLRFQGVLSLENNGGFASVRRMLGFDLRAVAGVRLRVRGDGRTYQFRVRQDEQFDKVAWRADFTTNGEWQTIELLFEQFQPVWRGRPVNGAGPIVAEKTRQIGFLLADGKPEAFVLEIGAIEFIPEG